jgi:hypothetical protein
MGGDLRESLAVPCNPAQENQQRAGISLMILPAFAVLPSGFRSPGNPANPKFFYTPLLPLEQAYIKARLPDRLDKPFYFITRIQEKRPVFKKKTRSEHSRYVIPPLQKPGTVRFFVPETLFHGYDHSPRTSPAPVGGGGGLRCLCMTCAEKFFMRMCS